METCKYCGSELRNLTGHYGNCKHYQAKMLEILKTNSDHILKEYTEEFFSIKELSEKYGIGRTLLDRFLVENKIVDDPFHPQRMARRQRKIKSTFLERYGVINTSQLEETKTRVKKTNLKRLGVENPFSSKKFRDLEYIKGQKCKSEDQNNFYEYKKDVEFYTKKNKKNVAFTGYCYYLQLPIFLDDGQNNYNDDYHASLEHKISILKGFYLKISPSVIGGTSNLCYCARIMNSIKREMSEEEFRLTGIIERYKEIYESQKNN